MKHPIRRYARFVAHHPVIMLVILLVVTGAALHFASLVGTKSMDNNDMIPDDIPVMQAFEIIENDFGGSDSVMISVESDPRYANSNEPRDMRDPDIVRYLYVLTQLSEHIDDVSHATSMGTMLAEMNGNLPTSPRVIKQLVASTEQFDSYISEDYSHALIRISLRDTYEDQELVHDMQMMIMNIEEPAGVNVRVAGEIVTNPVIESKIQPDMQRTSQFSMAGILIILLLLFWSVRYALTPLTVIVVGLMWAYGFFGLIGTEISSATSGAMSMIMGIGIDFGIQTIKRFRDELAKAGPEMAMEETLANVFLPMFTTTMAALIGFRAMSMGSLTIMEELGTMMSYGIAACFLAAITVVPVISVLGERFMNSLKKGAKKKRASKKGVNDTATTRKKGKSSRKKRR